MADINSLYPQPPPQQDLLGVVGQAQNIQGKQIANEAASRELIAKQIVGHYYNASLNQTTGELDTEKLRRLVAADPNTAWEAANVAADSLSREGQQYANASQNIANAITKAAALGQVHAGQAVNPDGSKAASTRAFNVYASQHGDPLGAADEIAEMTKVPDSQLADYHRSKALATEQGVKALGELQGHMYTATDNINTYMNQVSSIFPTVAQERMRIRQHLGPEVTTLYQNAEPVSMTGTAAERALGGGGPVGPQFNAGAPANPMAGGPQPGAGMASAPAAAPATAQQPPNALGATTPAAPAKRGKAGQPAAPAAAPQSGAPTVFDDPTLGIKRKTTLAGAQSPFLASGVDYTNALNTQAQKANSELADLQRAKQLAEQVRLGKGAVTRNQWEGVLQNLPGFRGTDLANLFRGDVIKQEQLQALLEQNLASDAPGGQLTKGKLDFMHGAHASALNTNEAVEALLNATIGEKRLEIAKNQAWNASGLNPSQYKDWDAKFNSTHDYRMFSPYSTQAELDTLLAGMTKQQKESFRRIQRSLRSQ